MADSDHWLPFDEDDNSSLESDDDNALSLTAMMREQHEFLSSTCIINTHCNSIEIHGADLNAKIIHKLFEQINDRLLQITDASDLKLDSHHDSNNALFDITAQLLEIKEPLRSFQLIYVSMTCDTLSLLSNIISLCSATLNDIELELMISIQHTQEINEQQQFKISLLFDEIMRKCSTLSNLEGIGIDLINFPLSCYRYFSYFDAATSFLSLRTLRIFICKENSAEQQSLEKLFDFVSSHEYLDGIRLIVNDIEDDGIWDELLSINCSDTARFELFEGDVRKFNAICFDIICALNRSKKRCSTLRAFSFSHYLSDDLAQYLDILSVFISKHSVLSEIRIVFNQMSDVYLSQLLSVMHRSERLMANLEYLELDSTKLHDFEVSNAFEVQYIDDDDDDDDEEKELKTKYKHNKKDITQSHFGRQSVLELAQLISRCDTLIEIEMNCFYGIDANAFNALTASIISHGALRKLTLNNLQRSGAIFDGLRDIFRFAQYSFLDTVCIEFNRHYFDALRREKYTIPQSFYQTLNEIEDKNEDGIDGEHEIEKELRPHCKLENVYNFVDALIESQFLLLRYLDELKQSLTEMKSPSFSQDVIRIIVDFVFLNEENPLIISLKSLPNDIKSKLIHNFKQKYRQKESKWNTKIKRTIQINSHSTNSIEMDANQQIIYSQ